MTTAYEVLANGLLYRGWGTNSLSADESSVLENVHPELKRFKAEAGAPSDSKTADGVRQGYYQAAALICLSQQPSRERSIALTDLESSMLWALKGYYTNIRRVRHKGTGEIWVVQQQVPDTDAYRLQKEGSEERLVTDGLTLSTAFEEVKG